MYVVIHELAHIGSDSVGHNEEFYTNFIYLLRVAINIGVYQKINYQLYPTNYCGLVINESPFY